MEDEQQTPSGPPPLSVTPPVPAWFLTAVAWDLTGVMTGIVTSRQVSPAMGRELADDWAATSTTLAQT